jgi:hypothetical protein
MPPAKKIDDTNPEPVAAATEVESKVEVLDREAEMARRAEFDQAEEAAARRAAHVAALQNEHDYLTRQPSPSDKRVAAVKAQLDEYSDAPTDRNLETRG